MRNRLLGFALTALGVLAFACSSSPPDPLASFQGFCTSYAKAICQVGSTCQFDVSTCETYQDEQCLQSANVAMSGGTRAYNEGNAKSCISALNGAYGGSPSNVGASTYASIVQQCNDAFAGTAADQAACTTNYDCKDPTEICSGPPGTSPVCAKATPKTVGEACADPGDQCPPGSTCTQPMTGSPKCTATAPASMMGQPCASNNDCSTGLFCDTYTSANAPTPVCVSELSFARASADCLGIAGMGTTPTPVVADAGVGKADSGASPADAGSD